MKPFRISDFRATAGFALTSGLRIFPLIAVALLFCGCGKNDKPDRPEASPAAGANIEICVGEKVQTSEPGDTVRAESQFAGTRALSWFGQSPIQAVEKRVGLSWGEGGISFGGSKGYGLLESLWDAIKDVFWFGAFGLIVLVILLFIPATAPVAGAILRVLASVVPFLGSLIERIVSGFKVKAVETPLEQVIDGGEKFKTAVSEANFADDVQKNQAIRDKVLELFRSSQSAAQDQSTQTTVRSLT
ncbi:MAG TPA: hypothetical protein PK082_10900 [Phycisphaerae bacterium]|nr:hypothetical protein [Phycisphaerae bacterium]